MPSSDLTQCEYQNADSEIFVNIDDNLTTPTSDITQCEYQNDESEMFFHSNDNQAIPSSDLTQWEYQNVDSEIFSYSDDNLTTPTSDVSRCEYQNDEIEITFHSDDIPSPPASDKIKCEYQSLNFLKPICHNTNRESNDTNVIAENENTIQTTQENNKDKSSKSKTCLTRNPPKLQTEVWKKYNTEFREINQSDWNKLKKGHITPEQYITDINVSLASYLQSKPDFLKERKDFFKHKNNSVDQVEKMRRQKVALNKKAKQPGATEEDKEKAREAIRMHNYVMKVHKEKNKTNTTKKEMKAFKDDFWTTARNVTNGTFGDPESKPTFSKDTANKYYKERYESVVDIDMQDLSWFPTVETPAIAYNLKPYTPKDVRNVLSKKDPNSAPGLDEIVYEYLLKMPFLHQALATAFTKIRDEGVAPECWGESKVILIKKAEDEPDDEPTSFRMISLTINIGKIYHTLEAQRMLDFIQPAREARGRAAAPRA